MTTDKPVHEIRLGLIKVKIWANETENGTRYNVTLCRLYRVGETWKTSDSFGRDELPIVGKALDMAHTWMLTLGVNASAPAGRSEFDDNGAGRVTHGGAR